MLQFTLMTEADREEAAKIDRRRAIEEERKKRIFNPRTRLIGLDNEALNKQIIEKKQQREQEQQTEEIFQRQMLKYDQIALAMEQQEKEERRKLQHEINEFRNNYQRFEDRREFDLNDPDGRRKILPARLHDDDPRLGISSVQKFEGEDIASEERAKVQREQIQSWLQQQIDERNNADKERKAAEEAFKLTVIARDERAIQLDQMEKECRRRLNVSMSQFNKALAQEQEKERREKERQEKEDNLAQMYNNMTSDMMTENPDVSVSSLHPDRRIGYLYKGMNKAERDIFRAEQQKQIEEKRQQKAADDRQERDWMAYMNGTQKTIAVMDQEIAKKKRELQKQIAEENKRLSIEQKNQQDFLNKIVYKNKPTAAYYAQFNTSTR